MPGEPGGLAAAPPGTAPEPANGEDASRLGELRELLLGRERRRLEDVERRLEALGVTPEELAELLPAAVVERTARDDQLAIALAPTLEKSLLESVERNPERIAAVVYPVIGPAIRMAIAESMAGMVASINRAIEHSLSPRGLRWRLEAWRSGVPFAQVVLRHALVYRIEQVFLVHRETGLLLAHAAVDEREAQDPDLVSAMLTAIRDFVRDSFAVEPEAGLRQFAVGEVTVYVEAGPGALLAAAVRGQPPPELAPRLREVAETLHLQYRGALAEFTGDTAAFEPARPLLASCLETVLSTDRPERRSAAPRVAWSVLALLLLGLLAWRIAEGRRWAAAVERLEREPGIVLAQSERGRLSGLRDPLAAAPTVVLAAAGIDVEGLEMRWEPYLSLDPRLVLARAERVLAPPSGVELALEGDTLLARGTAPAEWIAAAERSASRLPGIERLDASALAATLPAELAEPIAALEARRVLFERGSAALGSETRTALADLATSYLELRAAAAALGYAVGLELVGRTDESGSSERNRALAGERARAVRETLIELGLTETELTERSLASAQPLAAADAASAARINRSVAFAVDLRRAAPERSRP